jgi:hypothetical protein
LLKLASDLTGIVRLIEVDWPLQPTAAILVARKTPTK